MSTVQHETGLKSGTSMAAPYVAGAMALVKQLYRRYNAPSDGLSVAHYRQLLDATASRPGTYESIYRYGSGILNVWSLLITAYMSCPDITRMVVLQPHALTTTAHGALMTSGSTIRSTASTSGTSITRAIQLVVAAAPSSPAVTPPSPLVVPPPAALPATVPVPGTVIVPVPPIAVPPPAPDAPKRRGVMMGRFEVDSTQPRNRSASCYDDRYHMITIICICCMVE